MITTIILSKDRPAQLDLLLRSIERNGGGQFDPIVLWKGGTYSLGNLKLDAVLYKEFDFEIQVRALLDRAREFVCFMCDDGILYRPMRTVALDHDVLCFSLRLGENTSHCYPTGRLQESTLIGMTRYGNEETVRFVWDWTMHPRDTNTEDFSDFGYPGSIDAHVFRTTDVRRMLDGKRFPNPTALECALVEGCNELGAERPLMACYQSSVYVGNPINRVSEQSGVRYGTTYPVTAEECNRRFLAGERIDLDALDFSHVNGAHTEIGLVWS